MITNFCKKPFKWGAWFTIDVTMVVFFLLIYVTAADFYSWSLILSKLNCLNKLKAYAMNMLLRWKGRSHCVLPVRKISNLSPVK